ncbi:MAG: PEGA domain-containing protein [Archangium sp.]|nr:PEGA domain-containing protein [Archangium sp.]
MRLASMVVVAVVLVAGQARAGKKTVIVAGGDCADPSLISGAKDFRDAATKLLGAQLMEGEGVLDIVRPRPTRSLQDIERQVESARALFYGGTPDRALELVERALAELERASPEARPWPVTQAALVLQALVHKNNDHPKEMNDAFRRIVRLDPAFKLDPDAHPPTAVAAVEALKKELGRTRKASLLVRVEAGPAATVFIDGLAMGATPLKLELVPGSYRVAVTAPGRVSFPHRVELPRDSKLSVDLSFEGSLGLQAPLCLAGPDDGAAIKLAQLVAAESVIILRNTGKQGEPPFISGSLIELSTGQQERSGAVTPALVANLATFLITGKEQVGITGQKPALAMDPAKPVVSAVEGLEPPPPSPVVDARQPTFDAPGGLSTGRIASFTLLGVGAAAALAGGLLYAVGEGDRYRLRGISDPMPTGRFSPYSKAAGKEALELMVIVDTTRVVAFSLLGAGAGSLVAGALGLLLFPAGTTSLALSASPAGGALHVSGTF